MELPVADDSKNTTHMDVEYVAHLARLHLAPGVADGLRTQLERILSYVDELKSVDVAGVEPTAHAIPVENRLREDRIWPSIDHELAMKNAPLEQDGQFIVPQIIE